MKSPQFPLDEVIQLMIAIAILKMTTASRNPKHPQLFFLLAKEDLSFQTSPSFRTSF